MNVAFYTLGCKVNQYETEQMRERFIENGDAEVLFSERADCYIISTCTVTAVSDKKSRQAISAARRRGGEKALVVAAGCYSQVAGEELLKLGLDLVVGNEEKADIVRLVHEARVGEKAFKVRDIAQLRKFAFAPNHSASSRTRAHIKIEDGCNNFCSYCIIPYARGRVRSAKISDILCEYKALVSAGYKEVVLTGIEIASFGADTGERLVDLITALDAAGGARIRLGSLEPRIVTPEFISALRGCKNLCPHFHLSLQSGSDRVLALMKRRYGTALYGNAVRALSAAFSGCAVTTDIIAGFPGEREEDHRDTIDFVRMMGFAKVHVFPYSERKGTPAASLPSRLPASVKKRRALELAARADELHLQFLEKMVGETVQVLFETERDGSFIGHSENFSEVALKSAEDLSSQLIEVKIVGVSDGHLVSERL